MIIIKKLLLELEYPTATGEDLHSYRGNINWKGKIVYMSPDKFLRLAAKLPDQFVDKESISNLERKMLEGSPLDPLSLSVDMSKKKVTGHEGRHRAMVAKKLGIVEVPVFIYTGGGYDRVPSWSPEQHSEVDKSEFLPEK